VTLQDMTPVVELERLRAEFLGMVSQGLRAPLTSIKGSAATLLESLATLDPAETEQFIRIIEAQANRMRDLISELLDVANIATGALSVTPQPVAVAGLIDEARNPILSGGAQQPIVIDLEPDLPWVMADRCRIEQVLTNLLANASKYSDEASLIQVTAIRDGVDLAILVEDQGRGVSPERLPDLFKKFARMDGDENGREVVGAGMGLAICKGIVEAHGGRIWAESKGDGLGTRFTFTLPLVAGPGVGAIAASRRSPVASRRALKQRERILAVDDDPQTLSSLRETLTNAGYDPVVTAHPGDALRLMAATKPRLVLLDLVLPGTDGIDLMQEILARADLPVIFLSAYGRDQIIARAFELGAADYMVKPFSPTELVARVQAALRRPSGRLTNERSETFVLGDLTIAYPERRAAVAGRTVALTSTEFDLLAELSDNVGRVLTHEDLLRRVWGPRNPGSIGVLRTFVRRIRLA
jgi:DNA-binding response OmpR family regulator